MPDPSDAWRRALTGDRDAFTEATAPHQDTLLAAARRQVDVQREAGTLTENDLTPEELVGETLVRAYDRRASYDPDQMGLRAWLLGLQTRALARLARSESRHAARNAVSLDEEVPTGRNQDTTDEEFWEFREPFDVLTYGDLVPGSVAADADATEQGVTTLTDDDDNPDGPTDGRDDANALTGDPDADRLARAHHAALLHDEFDLSLAEVARIFDESLKATAENLGLARATLRERIGSEEDFSADDPAVDSYTGDPLPDA
jgi:DNA-directed RNA polymerase specialized sigma24 family protein